MRNPLIALPRPLRSAPWLLLPLFLLAACGGGSDAPATQAQSPAADLPSDAPQSTDAATTPADAAPADAAAPSDLGRPETIVLAAGEFLLPAASAFGESGFHEVLAARATLPAGLGATSGLRPVLALRDASRPQQTCGQQHPLSGCATVDWSDSETRAAVPPGGVFDNRIDLRTTSGPRTLTSPSTTKPE